MPRQRAVKYRMIVYLDDKHRHKLGKRLRY